MGPTASGKTELAVRLAERLSAEIISVDSMQVYREMDIGTAKPTMLERRGIPHHMIDIVDPHEEFSVAEFRAIGRRLLESSTAETMIITGGSGLHFRALVDPMSFAPTDRETRDALEVEDHETLSSRLLTADPEAGAHVDLANRRRVIRALEIHRLTGETPSRRAATAEAEDVRRYQSEIPFIGVGVDPGAELESRVDLRLERMRQGGLFEEVRRLAPTMGRTASHAVGYRELREVVAGTSDIDHAFTLAARNTKKLARRQRTWFQRDPRIRWIPWVGEVEARVARAVEALE
ncbi:MAG: tRNA (adenosine(37)-N6)-dimethylallyltransferase MiaA [Acidimicrobiia bacterium]